MDIEHNTCIGHPITNLLMREAAAADMGAMDHADPADIALYETTDGAVITMNLAAANIELSPAAPADAVSGKAGVESALKTLLDMCYGDMITQEMVDAVQVVANEVA